MNCTQLLNKSCLEMPEGVSKLDAELLLSLVFGRSRVWLLAHLDEEITNDKLDEFHQLWQRRCRLVPFAYLSGHKEFYGYDFSVDKSVLIPRPDSELLIDCALALNLPKRTRVLDLGTGSGALAITLALQKPSWQIDASDISTEALEVAKHNAKHHGVVDRVRLLNSDWFADIPNSKYDLIISNPPYIDSNDTKLDLSSRLYEPSMALFAKQGTLTTYQTIFIQAKHFCHQDSLLLFEHGQHQADELALLAQETGYRSIQNKSDLAGIERVLICSL